MALRAGGKRLGMVSAPTAPTIGGLTVTASRTGNFGRGQGGLSVPANPITAFFARQSLEPVVRPFSDSKAFALLDRILARRLRPGEEAEASIQWGAASRWSIKDNVAPEQPSRQGVNIIDDDPDPPEDQPDPVSELVYTETFREVRVVRVSNPEDPTQYVDVEAIDRIGFIGPDNIVRVFVLDNAAGA